MRKVHAIKTELAKRGLTQTEVALAIGIGPSLFSNLLNGHAVPWPKFRRDIAAYLGIPESVLFPEVQL